METESDLRRELAVGRTLAALSRELLAASESIPEMAEAVLACARTFTGSEHGCVSVFEVRAGDPWVRAQTPVLRTCSIGSVLAPRGTGRRCAGLCGHAFQAGEPFYTNTPLEHPVAPEGVPEGVGPGGFLAAPAIVSGRAIGQVVVATTDKGTYDEQDLRAVERLADIFALAVDRKQADDALARSEELHREAQRIAQIGHWALDLGPNRLVWSDEVFRIFEIDQAHFGASYEAFLDTIHPDDREVVNQAYTTSLRDRRPYEITHRLLFPDGRVKYVHERCHTSYDEEGNPIRSIGTVQDVTRLKEAETEKEKFERQLRHTHKMEAIGTLASGIAHDFNNVLTPILGYAGMVLEDLPEEGTARRHLAEVLAAARRAADLVRQILTFCRQSEQEFRPLRLQPIIKEALRLLRASVPTTIEIRQDIDAASGAVSADPTQIHQVVMNLCTNAYHAMRETGGVLGVALRQLAVEPGDYAVRLGLSPGDYVRIDVSDTGHGMTEAVRDRIFEPYFTTKGPGEGTGLGLSIVDGIVRGHGGYVTVYSEAGRGSAFHVYLPCTPETARPTPAIVRAPTQGSNERILIVDDELAIATMVEAILAGLGYRVTALTSAVDALASFRAHPDDYDLVLTDQTMPHLTGTALARELRQIRPNVRIVLFSGFGELVNGAGAQGIDVFLSKPVLKADLVAAVRRALDGQ